MIFHKWKFFKLIWRNFSLQFDKTSSSYYLWLHFELHCTNCTIKSSIKISFLSFFQQAQRNKSFLTNDTIKFSYSTWFRLHRNKSSLTNDTIELNSFFFVVVKVRLQTTQLNWNFSRFRDYFCWIFRPWKNHGHFFRISWFFWHKIQFRPPNFSLLGSNLYSTWSLEFYFHLGFKKPGINLSKTHFFPQI